jgi:hypothetical protein
MKELTEKFGVKPQDFYSNIAKPTNREHAKGNMAPFKILHDPAVIASFNEKPEELKYVTTLLVRVGRDYPTMEKLRKELSSGNAIKTLNSEDPDTPTDRAILENLFLSGLFRSM